MRQRLRFRRSSNIFAWGALTYSLDEGQMSACAEARLPSNLPDVLRVAALSGRVMGVCLCEAR
jgi:hypothetical protein